MLTYTITFGLEDDSPARMIRQAVFMEEQGFENEFDQQDQDSYHLVFYDEQTPVGCVRLFHSAQRPGWMTLGRVAILAAFRHRRYGLAMLEAVEKEAREKHALGIELSSQLRVQPFYEKGGYTALGEVYMDEHCEHIHMEKVL